MGRRNRRRDRRTAERERRPAVLHEVYVPPDTHPECGNALGNEPRFRAFRTEIPRIPTIELELAYRRNGIIWKGVNRKARDALKKGFSLVPDSGDSADAKELNAQVRDWMRATAYTKKANRALREMFVFGDGFLELGFTPDDESGDEPPLDGATPTAVWNIDPFAIRPVKEWREGRLDSGEIVMYLTGAGVRDLPLSVIRKWWEGNGELPRGVSLLHPDRVQHFQVHSLRDDPDGLGISVIEAAYMNALSKMMGDRAAGDILEWYAQGFFVLTIRGASEPELKKALDTLETAKRERRNYFAGSDRSTFDIKSPSIANVKPFYDNFYIELSAALELPTMLLLGVQKGTVTGSETDTVEYYDDVAAFQAQIFDADMYDTLSRVLGRTDFTIEWTPLYTDKQTEANIRFKDVQSATALVGAKVLTKRQAVHFVKTGELPDEDDVPDEYGDGGATQTKTDPGNPDEPRAKPEPPGTGNSDAHDEDSPFAVGLP